MFKVGDIVKVKRDYYHDDHNGKAVTGRIGTIIALREQVNSTTVDFGEGFGGHSGGLLDGKNTHWYIPACYLEKITSKKGNYNNYA